MARDAVINLTLDEVVVPEGRRSVDENAVKALALSIQDIGLQHPITCRSVRGGGFQLVAGRHRLEAVRSLGERSIPAVVAKFSDRDARRWEIAENLHRADLTELQRKEQIAEWIAITEAEQKEAASAGVLSQVAKKPQGGRPEGGINAARQELGIDKDEAYRAVKIDSISEQAKQAAIDAHLDNNQSALMAIARTEPEHQVAKVAEIAEAKALRVQQDIQNRAATAIAEILVADLHADAVETIRVNLAVTSSKAVLAALANLIGESIMDRRHG